MKILIITSDPIAEKMAGPGIRAFEIAKELSHHFEVRLFSLSSASISESGFTSMQFSGKKSLLLSVEWSDVVIFQGFILSLFPWIIKKGKILVSDLYAPMILEHLEQLRNNQNDKKLTSEYSQVIAALNFQIENSHHFLCATEEQKLFWLGYVSGRGRLVPSSYNQDQNVDYLFSIVPFGIQSSPHDESSIKKSNKNSLRLVWGGGIYDWFDPLTLIQAIAIVAKRIPYVELHFLGTSNPNSNVKQSKLIKQCESLSAELLLLDKHIYFHHGWIPYQKRFLMLAEADIGVSIHQRSLETMLSFRTRILDYIWANLPILTTEGDYFANLVRTKQLGEVAEANNPQSVANAIFSLSDESKRLQIKYRLSVLAEKFTWENSTSAFIEFLNSEEKEIWKTIDNSTYLNPTFKRRSWLAAKISGIKKRLFS